MREALALLLIATAIACAKRPAPMKSERPALSPGAPSPAEATQPPAPPTTRQLDRRQRSIAMVAQLGLPYFPQLPVVEDDADIQPRTVEEVAHRCLALTICAAKGETGDQALTQRLVKDWGADGYFTPKERAFIRDPHPTQQALVDHSWHYEGVHVLLWALSYIDHVLPPDQQCPVPEELKIIQGRAPSAFVRDARLRPTGELLDMADLYYRINWAAVELRVKHQQSPAVHPGIAFERHRAVNWLIRYMDADWDDVTTDT